MTLRFAVSWMMAVGCGGDKTGDTGADDVLDGDTDTDADSDTDTDTDTDTDSDTDTDDTDDTDTDTGTSIGPEPTCADAASQPPSEEEFFSVLADKFCWLWDQECHYGASECPLLGSPITLPPYCTYQPQLACGCLDAPVTCGENDGLTMPVIDPSCYLVLGCEYGTTDTGTSTDTGTP